MNSKNFKLGDILEASNKEFRKGRYPIIYISGHSEQDFIGGMLTHHSDEVKNARMKDSHFESGYPIINDNSFLVKGRFIKPEEWGTFVKVGQLTNEGIEFLLETTEGFIEEPFSHYYARTI